MDELSSPGFGVIPDCGNFRNKTLPGFARLGRVRTSFDFAQDMLRPYVFSLCVKLLLGYFFGREDLFCRFLPA